MIPNEVIEDILRRISIVDLISQRLPLKKSGRNYTGFCPFHNDKNKPSLSVDNQKGLYHCFSCGAGGNSITFLKEYDKMDFLEAVRELGSMTGIDVDSYLNGNDTNISLRNRLKTMHEIAQEFFTHQLFNIQNPSTKIAVATIKNRKLDKKTIEKFGIGYGGSTSDSLFQHLKNKGFQIEEITISGLCGKTDQGKFYDRFRNRITFPICDSEGIVVGFGGRSLYPNASAKYINSPETPLFKKSNLLYAWHLAKEQVHESGEIILVEGYMDVIRMFQAGFSNTAAPLGTGLSEDRINFLKNKTDKIILCFDGDLAGNKSAYRSAGIAAKIGVPTAIIQLPPDEDPDTFLLNSGPNALAQLIEQSLSAEEFVIQSTKKFLPNIKKFLQASFEYAVNLEGNISSPSISTETENFLKKLSETALTSFSSIEMEFSRFKDLYFRHENIEKNWDDNIIPDSEAPDTYHKEAEKILAILIMFPEFADHIAEIVEPNDFPSEDMQNFYKQILLHPERTSNEWIIHAGGTSFIKETAKFTDAPDIRTIKNHAVILKIESLKQKRTQIGKEILLLEAQNQFSEQLSKEISEIQSKIIFLKREFYYL